MRTPLRVNGEAFPARAGLTPRLSTAVAGLFCVGILLGSIVPVAAQEKKSSASQAAKTPTVLKYGDGKADGKKSLAGTGEMIRFAMPEGASKVRGLKIHGARYGTRRAPKEDFEITLLSEDLDEILHTETSPYRLFKRGASKWVRVRFEEPIEVPQTFWVVLDFQAEQTKGVYVSFDTSTGGKHSRVGLAGDEEPKEAGFGGDWMIQALLGE